MEKTEQNIVIKRVKKVAGGAHGGAWKIGFADFALALMAFFLVLWLIESTTNLEKMAIAGYFSDPTNLGAVGDGGTPYVLDLQGRPLFDSGRSRLRPYAMEILWAMGRIFGNVPNKVSVFGHTDSARFGSEDDYSNWELSSDRANAARRALVDGGLHPNQVAQIIGMADSVPLNTDDPLGAMNRRIVILVLNSVAQSRVDALSEVGLSAPTPGPEILPATPTVEIF